MVYSIAVIFAIVYSAVGAIVKGFVFKLSSVIASCLSVAAFTLTSARVVLHQFHLSVPQTLLA